MADERELRPCPFCGSRGLEITRIGGYVQFVCKGCDCGWGPPDDATDMDDVIEAWNRRADAPQPEERTPTASEAFFRAMEIRKGAAPDRETEGEIGEDQIARHLSWWLEHPNSLSRAIEKDLRELADLKGEAVWYEALEARAKAVHDLLTQPSPDSPREKHSRRRKIDWQKIRRRSPVMKRDRRTGDDDG